MTLTNVLLGLTAAGIWVLAGPIVAFKVRRWVVEAAHPEPPPHRHFEDGPPDKRYQLNMTPEQFAKHLPYLQKEGLVKGGPEKNNGHAGTYL
jgi:hypothetical protein